MSCPVLPRALGATLAAVLATLASACGTPQKDSCRRFVACVSALDSRDGTSTNVARFEPDGDCWGGAEGANLCGRACERGLPNLVATLDSPPAECLP